MNRRDWFRAGLTTVAALPLLARTADAMDPAPRIYGDGVHDDTAAIQWYLDRGVPLTLRGGEYRLSRPLHVGRQARATITHSRFTGGGFRFDTPHPPERRS